MGAGMAHAYIFSTLKIVILLKLIVAYMLKKFPASYAGGRSLL
jgi:flagellar biogenesis protein FliO